MANGLLGGLVSTNQAVTADIHTFERVHVEEIGRLWQVYSANRATLPDNVGRRLENFFWRIWSTTQLLQKLSGELIAAQFSTINKGGGIRTTPPANPGSSPEFSRRLASRHGYAAPAQIELFVPTFPRRAISSTKKGYSFGSEQIVPPMEGLSTTEISQQSFSRSLIAAPAWSPGFENEEEEGTVTPTPASPFADVALDNVNLEIHRSHDKAPTTERIANISSPCQLRGTSHAKSFPLRVVKKDEESAITSNEETSLPNNIPAAVRSPSKRRYIETRFSDQVAVSIPKEFSPSSGSMTGQRHGDACQTTSKRKPIVIASTGANKIRPTMMRQRSSQTSQTKPSPSHPHPGVQKRNASSAQVAGQSFSTNLQWESLQSIPHPSHDMRRYAGSPEHSFEKEAVGNVKIQIDAAQRDPQLVESRVSSQFADRRPPQHCPFTNPSTLRRKSSAVSAVPTSYQASGLLDAGYLPAVGSGKDAFRYEVVPLKVPAPVRPDLGDEPPVCLPKTKSHLTLLFEIDRAGSQEQASDFAEQRS